MRRFNFCLLLFCLGLFSACSGMLYFPSSHVFSDPAQMGYPKKDLTIDVGDNETLSAWYFSAHKKPVTNLVIFFHGNAENMTSHWATTRFLLDENIDVIVFDYRGYGKSSGSPSPEKTVQDGIAVVRWAQLKFPKLKITLFGQSLGGAVCLRTAWELRNEVKFKQIVVESTFLSYKKAGQRVLAKPWITWPFQWLSFLFLSDTWAPKERIKDLSPTPIFVIHGTADQTIDYDLGQMVFETALQPKEFWSVDGAGHTQSLWLKDDSTRKKFLSLFK